eukprot:Hpha_TRINITY_DN15849_c1_g6::TRINITY_DN15849_c1_g6_i1::g.191649::m.191649
MRRLGLVLAALATAASAREVPLLATNGEKHPTRYVATLRREPSMSAERLVGKYWKNKPKRIKLNKNKPGLLQLDFDRPADLAKFRKEEGANVEFLEHDVWGHLGVNLGPMACPDSQHQFFGAPWGLRRVTSNTLSSAYAHDKDWGEGVDVYVMDTGVRCSVQALAGRCDWLPGCNFVPDEGGVPSPNEDEHGHGTHCAGTVAGEKYGVAKKAKILVVKVLNAQGYGLYSQMVSALEWVLTTVQTRQRPGVVSFSIGGGYAQFMNDAIDATVAAGVQVAVAAGNSNADACSYTPSGAGGAQGTCVTVGATDQNDARSSFSNYGSCVDISAPGTQVLSSYIYDSFGNDCDNCEIEMSGTSMAAPHVAGMMAAYLGKHPTTSAADLKERVVKTALDDVIVDDQGSPNRLLHLTCGDPWTPSPPSPPPPSPPPPSPPPP